MAAFAGHNLVAVAIPKQNALAQASARGEQGTRGAGNGSADVQNAEVLGREMLEAVAGGAQIVHQSSVLDGDFPGENFGVDNPGQVCCVNAVIDDRAGHTKASGTNFLLTKVGSSAAQKLSNDQIKLCEFLARESFPKDHFELAVLF